MPSPQFGRVGPSRERVGPVEARAHDGRRRDGEERTGQRFGVYGTPAGGLNAMNLVRSRRTAQEIQEPTATKATGSRFRPTHSANRAIQSGVERASKATRTALSPGHPVSGSVLRGIIGRRVVTRQLVNHGTPAEPNWACEYLPFVPTDAALKCLLNAERRQDGSLLARAPPASPGRGSS